MKYHLFGENISTYELIDEYFADFEKIEPWLNENGNRHIIYDVYAIINEDILVGCWIFDANNKWIFETRKKKREDRGEYPPLPSTMTFTMHRTNL